MKDSELKALKEGDLLFFKEDESTFEFSGWTKAPPDNFEYPVKDREWWGPCWADSDELATIYDIKGEWFCDHGEGALLDDWDGKGFFVTKQELLDDFEVNLDAE